MRAHHTAELSRRSFIAALFAASGLPFLPSTIRAAQSGAAWTESAFRKAEPIIDAVKRHPFILGLADGTLPPPKFRFYLEEDLCYLVRYEESLSLLGKRLRARGGERGSEEDARDAAQLAQWALDTRAEYNRVRALFEKRYGASPALDPSPAALFYSDFEHVHAAGPSLGAGMAALLPCFWVYAQAGRFIASHMTLEGNPYREWIEWYGTPGFDAEVAKAAALADRLATEASEREREEMTAVFLKACRMEWMLWDAAWREAGWPV